MNEIPWRLAIDFGTSNTAAAVVQGQGGVRVLRLAARSDAMPSCVAAFDGEIHTGESALQIAGIYPSAFEPTPKRRLGEEAVVLGGKIFDPVDLVAAVLAYILGQATRFVGGGAPPSQVVLTHPEAWDEYMKLRLTAAAERAGIPAQTIRLLPEPVAAGWHYAAGSDVGIGSHVAVLDFGGGTCDAAVLELSQTSAGPAFHVVASGGIDPLGGHDFDAELEKWVYAQLAAEGMHPLLHTLKSERAGAERALLRDQIREAKHALSFHASAPIGVRSGETEWVCTVTRSEFELLIERQLDRAVELVHRVIHEALPSVTKLHRVYLTGGSSHIPALQGKLAEILPMKLGLLGDPKMITSIGALQAPPPRLHEEAIYAGLPHETAADPLQAANDGGRRGFVEPQPVTSDPSNPQRDRKPNRASKNVLIGGGVAAGVVLLGAAIALANSIIPTPPTPTPTTTTHTATDSPPPPPPRLCAGEERPGLSDGHCDLITRATDLKRVDPDSCTIYSELTRASFGLKCRPAAASGLQSTTIYLYSYTSLNALNTEFDTVIENYGAANRPVETPPGWQNWYHLADPSQKIRGRIMGATDSGTNYLAWTDENSLTAEWAASVTTDVTRLSEWWTALPQ